MKKRVTVFVALVLLVSGAIWLGTSSRKCWSYPTGKNATREPDNWNLAVPSKVELGPYHSGADGETVPVKVIGKGENAVQLSVENASGKRFEPCVALEFFSVETKVAAKLENEELHPGESTELSLTGEGFSSIRDVFQSESLKVPVRATDGRSVQVKTVKVVFKSPVAQLSGLLGELPWL